jgi:hypothetical protein
MLIQVTRGRVQCRAIVKGNETSGSMTGLELPDDLSNCQLCKKGHLEVKKTIC